MPPPKQMKCPPSSFFFGETDPEEINQLISELNEKTAVRKNDIAIKYYKIAKSVISPIISKIINKCISQGFFPDGLKIAQVSQTLFGNPKGPVELGNPNTCAETKLCLNFILFRLKK